MMPDGTLNALCWMAAFPGPFILGRQLADDPDSWIRNGRIANLEGVTFRNFFGRPCSGEQRSSVFWTSLPRRVKGGADLDVCTG